jgi:hypothetical protein
MTENKDASGATQDLGEVEESKKDAVSYEQYQRLLGQRKADKSKLDEVTARLKAFERAEEERKEAEMVQKEQFKELNAQKDETIEALKKERDDWRSTVIDSQKLNAVTQFLPGKIANSEYYNLIDLKQVGFDTETGQVDTEAAQLVANKFMETHSRLVDIPGRKTLPADAASTTTKLTMEQWRKLPMKERKERMGEVYDAYTKK